MKLIAHRSGPMTHPEQTIQSAHEAKALGADLIEIDVRFTADRQLAICHDPNTNRVFGKDSLVCNLTAGQFLALRHAGDAAYGAHLLEDYLRCGIAPLLLHVKEKEVIGDMLEMLRRYDYTHKAVIGVADVESARQIRAFDPSIQILSFAPRPEDTEAFIAEKIDYIRLWEGWLTPERVQQVKASASRLWVMSGCTDGCPVGEPTAENLRKIAAYEPDAILVNDVRFAQQALGMTDQRRIRNSAKALIIKEGKLLAMRIRDGKDEWHVLPGGGQETGETLDAAVIREVAEEAGLRVSVRDLAFVIEGVQGEPWHRMDLVFLCDLLGEIENAALHSDVNQAGWDWLEIATLNHSTLYPSKLRRQIMNLYEGKPYQRYLGNESAGDQEVTD